MRKTPVLVAFVVCWAAFGAHAQPLVVRVGPGQTYATISAAISSLQQPLQQDVLVEVTLTPNGYAESGMIVDASGIDMNGHSLEISGVQPVLTTYYFGDDLEFRVSGEDVTIIENVLADGVIARRVRQNGNAGPNEYLVKNHLGSTVAAISGDGQAVGDVVDYFSYGKKRVVQHSSGGSDPVTQSFTGKELDELGTGYSRIDLKIEFVETAMPQAPAINALTIAFTDGTSFVTSFEPLSGGATWAATSSKTFGFDKTIQSLRIQLETADPTVGTLDYTQSVNKTVREGEVTIIDYREHANDLSGCSGQNCIFVPDAVENALAMEETGLYYFGKRYYDAEIGVFTTTDPAEQFWNKYAYSSNPILLIDPDGDDFINVQYYYYNNQQLQSRHAIGTAKYYAGTPDDPGELLGQWISGSGGNPYSKADPIKPGEYYVGNKSQNVKGIPAWKTWAFRLMNKDGTSATAKSSGSGLWLHDAWKAITSMCIGITDMAQGKFQPKGDMKALIENSGQEKIPVNVQSVSKETIDAEIKK